MPTARAPLVAPVELNWILVPSNRFPSFKKVCGSVALSSVYRGCKTCHCPSLQFLSALSYSFVFHPMRSDNVALDKLAPVSLVPPPVRLPLYTERFILS